MGELKLEDIKKELEEYYDNQKIIDTYEKNNGKIERLLNTATKTTTTYSDMPKGSSVIQDRNAEAISEIVDLKTENKKLEDTNNSYLLEMKNRNLIVLSTILQLKKPYKSILYYKYIENQNLTKIANIISKEYKWVCKLHGKALLNYLEQRNNKNS